MNVEVSDQPRPLWERLLLQVPALAALVFFGNSFVEHQQLMDVRRLEYQTDVEKQRIQILSVLQKTLLSIEEQSMAHRQTTESLTRTINIVSDRDEQQFIAILDFLRRYSGQPEPVLEPVQRRPFPTIEALPQPKRGGGD